MRAASPSRRPSWRSQPQLIPLLLCAAEAADRDGPHDLDRIRMQKAVFLLTQRGPKPWRQSYEFEPYNWGPYCRELNEDLRHLQHQNLIFLSHASGAYGRYILTPEGQRFTNEYWRLCSEQEQHFFEDLREYVTCRDFNGLLRDVYEAYPTYAENSRWSGRR